MCCNVDINKTAQIECHPSDLKCKGSPQCDVGSQVHNQPSGEPLSMQRSRAGHTSVTHACQGPSQATELAQGARNPDTAYRGASAAQGGIDTDDDGRCVFVQHGLSRAQSSYCAGTAGKSVARWSARMQPSCSRCAPVAQPQGEALKRVHDGPELSQELGRRLGEHGMYEDLPCGGD